MAFRIPTFNLTCNIWRGGSLLSNPPDATSMCQLRATGKQNSGYIANAIIYALPEILFPAHTDVRDTFNAGGADRFEVPAGSGRFYETAQVDDVAKGFANEYRQAIVGKIGVWPTPIP